MFNVIFRSVNVQSARSDPWECVCLQDDSTALSIALEAGHNDIAVLLYARANFSRGQAGVCGSMFPLIQTTRAGGFKEYFFFKCCLRVLTGSGSSRWLNVSLRLCRQESV